jgi:hypothetical protein
MMPPMSTTDATDVTESSRSCAAALNHNTYNRKLYAVLAVEPTGASTGVSRDKPVCLARS